MYSEVTIKAVNHRYKVCSSTEVIPAVETIKWVYDEFGACNLSRLKICMTVKIEVYGS